ncbi:MAG: hypothetical protein PT116_16005 [Aphanizomenon gracile PMC638.10]|nr:hypothetical protein [Aphanizomenon gracile PMC638.10]
MTKYLEFSKVLDFIQKEVVKYIANLTEQEVEDILNEKVNVRISLQAKNSKLGSKTNPIRKNEPNNEKTQENDLISSEENLLKQNSNAQPISIKEIAQILNELNSCDEGFSIINQHLAGKKDLQKLAECLKIPQYQRYTTQKLREKIIEATIGYRLRSKAIQGDIQIVEFSNSTVNQVHEQENQAISEQRDIQIVESENPTVTQVHEQENQAISEQRDIQIVESENPTVTQVHEQENQAISEQGNIQIVEFSNSTVTQVHEQENQAISEQGNIQIIESENPTVTQLYEQAADTNYTGNA